MASTFEVLAEPSRRRILELLLDGELPVGELVGAMGTSQPAVSKRLRVLREAGLVESRTDAQRRLYRLRTEPLEDVDQWLQPYRRLWASRLSALERHLEMMDDDGWGTAGVNAVSDDEFGRLERVGGRTVARFTRLLGYSPEMVWRALTEEPHLASWFPTTIEGDLVAGGRLRFSFREIEIEAMEGELLAFDPPRLLAFTWGPDMVRFELAPDHSGSGSVLTLVVEFEEVGKAARDGAGWHSCLDLLACEVDGTRPPWSSDERWRQVRADYVERFGPDASTIGPPEEWEQVHGPA